MSPMQVLLSTIGGCSAIDIVSILKKQKQAIESFSMEVLGDREEVKDGAAVFKTIHVIYTLTGNVDLEKAKRAVELSMEKYCSVTKILEKSAKITFETHVK